MRRQMNIQGYFGGWLKDEECYRWGNLFASSWDEIVAAMGEKAASAGFTQEVKDRLLIWKSSGSKVEARFIFCEDPSDIGKVRRVFNEEANIAAPCCFVIVRQPDAKDTRGDVIFDIFKMSATSYLCHENRVYTVPGSKPV
jgi:hypothetical protein